MKKIPVRTVAKILETALESTLKTHIINKCSLGSKRQRLLIEQLEKQGFLEAIPKEGLDGKPHIAYKTTEKGKELLELLKSFLKMFEGGEHAKN